MSGVDGTMLIPQVAGALVTVAYLVEKPAEVVRVARRVGVEPQENQYAPSEDFPAGSWMLVARWQVDDVFFTVQASRTLAPSLGAVSA